MEKLLHERLREWVNKDKDGVPVLNEWTHYFGGTLDTPPSDCAIWESISDEIERYYIPRPRFEDGEPLQFNSVADVRGNIGEVIKMVFNYGGCEEVIIGFEYDSSASHYMVIDGEFVKRPTPKVYDADGVEVKVGDTVYEISNGRERKVFSPHGHGEVTHDRVDCYGFYPKPNELTHEKPVFDADGERIKVGDTVYDIKDGNESVVKRTDICNSDGKPIICKDGCPGELWYKPEQLTHTEPVFDAEGVRICKGDTVWHVTRGEKHTVEKVDGEDRAIYINGCSMAFSGVEFTHREPDSLEKLRDRMTAKWNRAWAEHEPITEDELHGFIDDITAFIERGA